MLYGRKKLTSIPPANRRPSRLSSMRAATRVRLTFVGPAMGGGGIGSVNRSSGREPAYKPHVIAPKPEVERAWEDYQEAWRARQTFWQQEVDSLKLSSLSEAFVDFLTSIEVELPEVKET